MIIYMLSPFMRWVRRWFLCSHMDTKRVHIAGWVWEYECLTCGRKWQEIERGDVGEE